MVDIYTEQFEVVQSGMRTKNWMKRRSIFGIPGRLRKMLKCIRSGEQVKMDEMDHSSDSLATRDYSASGYSSRPGEVEPKVDNSNIEEAESSLRESGYLNYEVGCILNFASLLLYLLAFCVFSSCISMSFTS